MKRLLLAVSSLVLVVFIAEGCSSLLLLGIGARLRHPLSEELHTRYDPDLGWVNIPDRLVEDLYGDGLDLQTNGQGFRNPEDFAAEVPAGKLRVVCSGDSFTLGYGVGDGQTWPAFLDSRDSRLQTVNMGQGGYGADQAFLWYQRDGLALAHDVQIFAVIGMDFVRMRRKRFQAFRKPTLDLEGGRLVSKNTPVPRSSALARWMEVNRALTSELRLVRLLQDQLGLGPSERAAAGKSKSDGHTASVALRVFEELKRMNDRKGSSLIAVYLPTASEYSKSEPTPWRDLMLRELPARGIPVIDLLPSFRALEPSDAATLYIDGTHSRQSIKGGHYSKRGNRLVANEIYRRAFTMPELRSKLSQLDSTGRTETPSRP